MKAKKIFFALIFILTIPALFIGCNKLKTKPLVDITSVSATHTDINFDLSIIDENNAGSITKIELLHNDDEPIISDDVNIRKFENLLSNNEYTINVIYTYDLKNGAGNQELTVIEEVTTLEHAVPQAQFNNIEVSTATISYNLQFTDNDSVGQLVKVELLKGNEHIADASEILSDTFEELSANSDYKIKATYTYNLNDGTGEQNASSETIVTTDIIDIVSVRFLQEYVSQDESFQFVVQLNNPLNAAINKAKINGELFDVTYDSATHQMTAEFFCDDKYSGGDVQFSLEEILYSLEEESHITAVSDMNANIFVNGELRFIDTLYINENGEEIFYCFPNDVVYLCVIFDNPTGYVIENIEFNGINYTDIIKIDDNRHEILVEPESGMYSRFFQSVTYSNEYVGTLIKEYDELKFNEKFEEIILQVSSNEIFEISEPEDFNNMDGIYYYKLMNDIDLSGIKWTPKDLIGCFDGNGFSINNLSINKAYQNTNVEFGLFKNLNGVVKNLNLKNVSVNIQVENTTEEEYDVYVGGITALVKADSIITSCSVETDITVISSGSGNTSVIAGGLAGAVIDDVIYTYLKIDKCSALNNINLNTNFGIMAGGLVGGTDTFFAVVAITECSTSNIVNLQGAFTYGGGLVGGNTGEIYIDNSCSSGEINTVRDMASVIGGAVGFNIVGAIISNNSFSSLNLNSDINHEDISYAGGWLGSSMQDSIIFIKNCYTTGNIIGISSGGLIGYQDDTGEKITTIENCYRISSEIGNNIEDNGIQAENIAEIVTVMQELWDDNIWDFENLSEDGNPTLKVIS